MTTFEKDVAVQLVGRQCHNFRLVEGGTLILYLSGGTDTHDAEPARLWIDCAWRFRRHGRVVVGSLDESATVVDALQALMQLELNSVDIDEVTMDLHVSFSGDVVIDAFPYSIVDEQWEVRLPNGLRIGVGPGLQPYARQISSEDG